MCLFTCAVTRAVHLEVVTDLSVQTFLLALRRFSGHLVTPLLVRITADRISLSFPLTSSSMTANFQRSHHAQEQYLQH